ncbi:MAG: acetylglutamate kinase [Bacteroidota bacterium]
MINVVKTGGKVLSDPQLFQYLLRSFTRLTGSKVLVHGGGNTATKMAEKLGIENKMINGRRITTDEIIDLVSMVYSGINKRLVASLQARSLNAIGLCGADLNLIEAIKRPVKEIDYGWVGDIVSVDGQRLMSLLEQDMLPVMAPLTHDKAGHLLNTNADTIAATVASAIAQCESRCRLILCFERAGVLQDPSDENSVIEEIDELDFDAYCQAGIIADGMIPKLHNAFEALRAGVEEVLICNPINIGKAEGADFVGTRVLLRSTKSIA